jgi:hypothetical protein
MAGKPLIARRSSPKLARVVTPVKQAETVRTAGRFLGTSCSFVPLSWTETQAKFNHASRPPQGFPVTDPASLRVE